jgi:hypothetical protein
MPLTGVRSDTFRQPWSVNDVRGMPMSGDSSPTRVKLRFSDVSGMPWSGAKSSTVVAGQSRVVSFMPFSGFRSLSRALATSPWRSLPPQRSDRSPANARTGATSVT